MRRLIAALTWIFLLAPAGLPEAGELILCRNASIREPVEASQVNALKEKACRLFRPGDKILAVYHFRQKGTEEFVEFKWKRRFGPSARVEEKSYLHRIERKSPGSHYLSFAWLSPPPGLFDLAIGSRFAGDWIVEVHVDRKHVAEAPFRIK